MKRAALLILMVLFGVGVNRYIAAHKTDLTHPVAKPTAIHAFLSLPGTVYVVQGGRIYALRGGDFHELPLPRLGTWMQPYVLADGSLLAVVRTDLFSDIYHVDADGHVLAQLTHNHVSDATVQLNHWAYWPAMGPDGTTLYASYDTPKPAPGVSYDEDLSIWSGPLGGRLTTTRWTIPDPYTGGDTRPQPLPGGALLYATYTIAPSNHVVSVIVEQRTPRGRPILLTALDDDCSAPAVAPDGVTVAMVCSSDTQTAKLEVAHIVNGTLDTPVVVAASCLCNAPAWAPDGHGLLYIAPADSTGHFQLWYAKGAGSATAPAPTLVTNGIDLDALSAPAWTIPAPAVTPSPSPAGP